MVRSLVRRARRKAYLAGLGILALGLVAGAAGMFGWMSRSGRVRVVAPPATPTEATATDQQRAERWGRDVAHRVRGDLNLDEPTFQAVVALFADYGQAMEKLRRETVAKMEPFQDKLRDDVAALLPPDQQKLWRELFRSRYFHGAGWQRRPGPGGPGGPGPGGPRRPPPGREGPALSDAPVPGAPDGEPGRGEGRPDRRPPPEPPPFAPPPPADAPAPGE